MVSPRVAPLAHASEMPSKVDVVVIGGGIIGASTALSLAERGVSVALCEKGRIAGEQSGRNWGWCRKMGRDPAEIPLAMESLRLWERMNARTGAETGFRQRGIVYLCANAKEAAQYEAWLEEARPFQMDLRMVASQEIDRLLPGSARRWTAALYTPSDGSAEPELATSAIANAAQRAGAVVLEHCAVRGIETSAGAVSGVVDGERRDPLQPGGAGRRRLDQPVLRQSRHPLPATEDSGIGDAHRTDCRRARAGGRRRQFRLPQAPRRRLYRRPAQRQHRRDRAGQFPVPR